MKNSELSARFFKFVYFTRHSHVTRAESQSNCIIWGMCGPPVFHLMFIFPQMGPKTCSPPSFYFLKIGCTTRFFLFFHGRSATFYGHFRADTVTSELSTCIPSSNSLYSCYFQLNLKYETKKSKVHPGTIIFFLSSSNFSFRGE